MKAEVRNFQNKVVGEIDLADAIFAADVRVDIMSRAVHWQLAKRRSGNHKTKGISEISGTTAKPWAQKGTGRARQGSLRSPQFRKGAVIFGPVVRDHGYDMNKKVRVQALCCALSAKKAQGKLLIVDAVKADSAKTKAMVATLKALGLDQSSLIIDGANLDANFALSVRNLPHVDLLPEAGTNVYDILRRDMLVLTTNAVEQLTSRLMKSAQKTKRSAAA